MSKVIRVNEEKEIVSTLPTSRRFIGVLMKNFSKSEAVCPQYWHKSVRSWKKGQVIWNEQEVDELVSLNAPIEVFYQDVNGTAKN
jgi:hypothetical protein